MIGLIERKATELPRVAPSDSCVARYVQNNGTLDFSLNGQLVGNGVAAYTSSGRLSRIQIASTLSQRLLEQILNGDCDCIRIPSFCSSTVAGALAKAVITHQERQNYHHEIKHADGTIEYLDYHVDRVGPVRNKLFAPETTLEQWREYHNQGHALMNRFREVTSEHGQYPIDKLLEMLNAVWPHGAQFDEVAPGVDAYAGVGRVTRPGKVTRLSEEPHTDSLPEGMAYEAQLGINVFLSAPEEDGELVVWDEMSGNVTGKVWAIKPEIGDLLIVRTDRPHSVNGFDAGDRVTLSCFAGLRRGESIKIWS